MPVTTHEAGTNTFALEYTLNGTPIIVEDLRFTHIGDGHYTLTDDQAGYAVTISVNPEPSSSFAVYLASPSGEPMGSWTDFKSLLSNCATSAIINNAEMHAYYQRRVNEGKDKMSTINIVRNKILGRIFAVVQRGTPYVNMAYCCQ